MQKRTSYKNFMIIVISVSILSGCAWNPLQRHTEQENVPTVENVEALAQQFIQTQSSRGVLQEDEWQRLLDAADKAVLFDDARGPELLKGKTYEEKLNLFGDLVTRMLADTGRSRISHSDSILTDTEIPPVDLVTGAKKFYYGADGEERYHAYLAQRFTIGVYPTMEELQGQWEGNFLVKDVMIFRELGGAPVQYTEEQIKSILSKSNPINFTITSTDENTGTIVPSSSTTLPFTYPYLGDFSDRIDVATFTYNDIADKGKMHVLFTQGRISGAMQIHATKENGTPQITGTVMSELYNGFIKINGDLTAHKK